MQGGNEEEIENDEENINSQRALCISLSFFFFHDDKLIWAMVFGFSS